jgi:hypothetical protein
MSLNFANLNVSEFMLDFNQKGPEELVLLRLIKAFADKYGCSNIYLVPAFEKKNYGIRLKTIQATLADLEEHEHIVINQKPNHNLSDNSRAKRDDEEDYYLITVKSSFYKYHKSLEDAADLFEVETSKVEHESLANTKATLKIKYDEKQELLTYHDLILPVDGVLQREVCKQVFKRRNKSVLYNDILDRVDENKQSRAVYDAVRIINRKIKQSFNICDVLIQKGEKVRIDKIYL